MKVEEINYFIPELEDIRIGYECEQSMGCDFNKKEHWRKYTLTTEEAERSEHDGSTGMYDLRRGIESKKFRTSYLTKEQIGNEGWKEMEAMVFSVCFAFPEIPLLKNEYRVDYNYETHNLLISKKHHRLFDGECKSINEFRYICKLLNI